MFDLDQVDREPVMGKQGVQLSANAIKSARLRAGLTIKQLAIELVEREESQTKTDSAIRRVSRYEKTGTVEKFRVPFLCSILDTTVSDLEGDPEDSLGLWRFWSEHDHDPLGGEILTSLISLSEAIDRIAARWDGIYRENTVTVKFDGYQFEILSQRIIDGEVLDETDRIICQRLQSDKTGYRYTAVSEQEHALLGINMRETFFDTVETVIINNNRYPHDNEALVWYVEAHTQSTDYSTPGTVHTEQHVFEDMWAMRRSIHQWMHSDAPSSFRVHSGGTRHIQIYHGDRYGIPTQIVTVKLSCRDGGGKLLDTPWPSEYQSQLRQLFSSLPTTPMLTDEMWPRIQPLFAAPAIA